VPVYNPLATRRAMNLLRLQSHTFAGWVCAALLAVGSPALAQDALSLPQVGYNYGEIETARTAALGGAQRALGNSIAALFGNPAGMATARLYHIGALAQIWPEPSRQSYGAAAVDSIVSSARLAGGLGGTYNLQDRDGVDRQWTDVRFALAYPFSDELAVGLGGRYLWLQQNGLGPLGDSLASGGLRDQMIVKAIGVDAGIVLRPTSSVALGLVSHNFNDPGHGFLPTSLGAGLGLGTDMVAVEADGALDFTTWDRTRWRGMGGATLLLADNYPLSAGYRYDSGAKSHAVSGGAGYTAREFSVELAVRRVVSGITATALVLELRYHVDATGLTPGGPDAF